MTDLSKPNPSDPELPNASESIPNSDTLQQSIGSRETIAPSGLDLTPTGSGPFASLPVQFGRFEVRKLLGRGAMGMVYLAFDPELQKSHPERTGEVALKIPKFQADEEPVLLERFWREARATGAMNHDNICGMYEVGEIGGTYFISMEYVDGRPLAEYIGPDQPQRQVAAIVRTLAQGLAHAHERGFLHRDLKPSNVMIAADGQPKIMDFGLARRFGVTGDIRLTQSNTIVGSPAYMSPEQARSENDTLTPASDIYSLGTLFFELLTGELPFKGPIAIVLGMIALQRVPKPSTVRKDIDPRLESFCLKMLEKKRDARPQSMTEVADTLTEWLKQDKSSKAGGSSDADIAAPTTAHTGTDSEKQETSPSDTPALIPKKPAASPVSDKADFITEQQRRVTELLGKRQYGPAIELLEKMANLRDAKFEKLVAWAKPKLKETRATEQKLKEASAPICGLAEQDLKRYDYVSAVHALEQVPPAYRSVELRDLLEQATDLRDECDHLQRDIEEAVRAGDTETLPALVRRLYKLKPNNKAIKQLAADVKQHGAKKVIALRKGQRRFLDPAGQTFEPQHIALYIVLVVGLFAGVSLMVRSYLTTSKPSHTSLTPSPTQPRLGPPMLGQSSANGEILKPIPADVVVFEKKLFKVFPEQLTWREAKQKCEGMGGRLAQINSQAENDFVMKLAIERRLLGIWLGATDEVQERAWLWTNGDGLAFNNFGNGQPDRSTARKRYLVMMLKDQVGWWCNQPSQSDDWSPGFVCEWNAPAVVEPARLPQDATSTSTGMTFTLIPAGTFTMGSPEAEVNRGPGQGPQHTVQISRPFYMGVYEVTQGEYESVMGTNPSSFKTVSGQNTSRFPVEQVSWNDAVEFCQKLSAKDGVTYRLPTEAEWEYACRANTTTPFHFGSTLNGDQANVDGNFPYGTTTKGPCHQRTTTVGSYPKNAFGLFDLHGNVWEWCEDVYDEKAYASRSGTTTDPKGTSGSESRVLRGGSWLNGSLHARLANRNWNSPVSRNGTYGFRVVFSAAAVRTPGDVTGTSPITLPQTIPSQATGMKLTLIPAGKFQMGSPDTEAQRSPNEGPQHTVEISRPFYMGVYEVTQGEYEKVMGVNPSSFKTVSGQDTSRFPVEQVSWNDAVEFCQKLSAKDGVTYRLPTEAEWEYACRAGATTTFHFGGTLNGDKANVDGSNPYGTATKGPFLQRTTTGGSYPKNAFGLFDMHGNVWE